MLTEARGCRILTEVFSKRGYPIEADVDFDEAGISFVIDGWCAASRIGFEYRTHAAADKVDLDDDEIRRLGEAMEKGRFFIFVIDEDDVGSPDDLALYANAFIDEVERRRGGQR
jgi:hypothetical protein